MATPESTLPRWPRGVSIAASEQSPMARPTAQTLDGSVEAMNPNLEHGSIGATTDRVTQRAHATV
eukprot:4826059-Pleurochrysis_carterae.AAC.1